MGIDAAYVDYNYVIGFLQNHQTIHVYSYLNHDVFVVPDGNTWMVAQSDIATNISVPGSVTLWHTKLLYHTTFTFCMKL